MSVVHSICRSHMESVAALPQPVFMQLVRSVSDGLDSLDTALADQASHALDHVASTYVRAAKKDSPLGAALRAQVMTAPGMFLQLMRVLFHILMFSENGNKYSLARPVLPIILAAELIQADVSLARARVCVSQSYADTHSLSFLPSLPPFPPPLPSLCVGAGPLPRRGGRHTAPAAAPAHERRVPDPHEGHHAQPRPRQQGQVRPEARGL
jgi:hypothetical protein